ncbi:hypothetical protein NMY22_g14195 [Coprinellus aureogranulatus]|nr:hypothetical protein NMY22_g14195 [Coprinellus aureogranulatus]
MAQSYMRNMLSQGLGISCWDTSLASSISCGDIGTITPENGFKKIWNLWDIPPKDVQELRQTANANSSSGTWTAPFPGKVLEYETGVQVYGLGDSFAVGAEVEFMKTDLGECTWKFKTTAEEGAMLAILSPVYRFNLAQKAQDELKRFIICNPQALYRLTLARNGGPLPPGSSLYFVTGYHKTSQIAMAGFTSLSPPRVCTLGGGRADTKKRKRPGFEQMQFSWDGGDKPTDFESKVLGSDEHGPHSLFLQGFSLLSRESYDSSAASAGTDDLSSELQTIHLEPSSSKNSIFNIKDQWNDVEISALEENNPSNTIDRAVLDQTFSLASFALAHDDDWRFLLKGQKWGDQAMRKLLSTIDKQEPVITMENDVAYFDRALWVDALRTDYPTEGGLKEGCLMDVDYSDSDSSYDSGRPTKRPQPGPYPLPTTEAEFKLANKILQIVAGKPTRSVTVRAAQEMVECTGFTKGQFAWYLNLTRGQDWGARNGELTADMLVYGLRAAAYTQNARHQPWSTLDTRTSFLSFYLDDQLLKRVSAGSMPNLKIVYSSNRKQPSVLLSFPSPPPSLRL